MNVMKFANNEKDQFVRRGAAIAYMVGFLQTFLALICQAINIYLLTYQHTVDHSIIHFVALHVVMDVPNLYLESLIGVTLREKIFEKKYIPKFTSPWRKDIYGQPVKMSYEEMHPWEGRTTFHKFARIFYKFIRLIFVSYIFYFGPITVLVLQWFG